MDLGRAGLMLLTWHCCAQLLLILLHPFTYSRGLSCLLPGVTLVVEHNVGAHAALPRLVPDWALHGKKMHTCCYLFVGERQGCAVLCGCLNTSSVIMASSLIVCFFGNRNCPSNSGCCFIVGWSLNGEQLCFILVAVCVMLRWT